MQRNEKDWSRNIGDKTIQINKLIRDHFWWSFLYPIELPKTQSNNKNKGYSMDTTALLSTFIEIEPLDYQQFRKVFLTLRRIGMPARKDTTTHKRSLIQTCHILQKQGRYYIVHFKQMFLLDGRQDQTNYDDEDLSRTETIAELLESWGLIKLISPLKTTDRTVDFIIISKSEIPNWHLKSKYTIGGTYEAPKTT